MVKIGGDYFRQYEEKDTYWMDDRWKRWLESDIERSWSWVRWGIETRDGRLTWQVVLLALVLPWAIGLWVI